MSPRVAIVPHTHWDREWYEPFQSYRLRLVRLLDEFLPLLERDPGYRHFLLDGQTAVVDDYLEVRPEATGRIRRLVTDGRLSVGPWMILMDEFMVSAETIVANLQAGIRRGAELGGAMPVGYLPDMFGHVAQMPQILSQAGLDHAVVWRGVPGAIRCTGFWWEAPDGSAVRAEYLYGSYSNGRDVPRDAKRLVERARGYETELGDARVDGLLMMNGTDHQVPQPWLAEVVAEANEAGSDYEFAVTSLPEHLAVQPVEGLPRWRGELRSGARANILMGVASNRVDVHQAAAAAERGVERRAEPLAALVHEPARHPGALLEVAWRNLILNSAHDSSCACSADEVVDQVLVRYREARQVADEVTREAARELAGRVATEPGGTVVVNPSSRPRSGVVEVPVPGEGPVHLVDDGGAAVAAQVVGTETGERFATQVVGSKLNWVLDMMRGREFAGAPVAGFSVEPRPEPRTHEVVVTAAGPGDTPVDVGPLRDRLAELAGGPHAGGGAAAAGVGSGDTDGGTGSTDDTGATDSTDEAVFHVRMLRVPTRRVLAAVPEVPAFGWRALTAVDGPGPDGPVSAAEAQARNEHLEVRVAPDGTFSVRTADGVEVSGLNRYVNGGDGGDTYNYSPPAVDRIVDGAASATVETLEAGPVRARLAVTTHHDWPVAAEGDERSCSRRSDETARVEVRTILELRAGEPFVRVHGELDNPCRDQRLRAHLPLPVPVDASDSECAFAVVRRGVEPEGGPNEVGIPTYPSRRFVDCSDGEVGLAVVHDGLLEHELVDDGRELAITLLRSVGYLSRVEPALRPNPAGPQIPVEGAQMQGRHRFDYAVVPHRGDWADADLYGIADRVLVPLERAAGGGPSGDLPGVGSLLSVRGAEVSACRREASGLQVRVFNPRSVPVTVEVARPDDSAPLSGWVVDLRNRPVEAFEGNLSLAPGRFATLLLPEARS